MAERQRDWLRDQRRKLWVERGFPTYEVDGKPKQRYLWDWLDLLVVPLMLACVAFLYSCQSDQRSQKAANDRATAVAESDARQATTEAETALDRNRQAALEAYYDRMERLLLEQDLRDSAPGEEVRMIAHAQTLATVRVLDGPRNGLLLNFLFDTELFEDTLRISLEGVDLSRADLNFAELRGVNLTDANLTEARLMFSKLVGAQLSEANLSGATLNRAYLDQAQLAGADLSGAFLTGAHLNGASLVGASLANAYLIEADLGEATLLNADFSGADLTRADFSGATDLTRAQLDSAATYKDAILPGYLLRDAQPAPTSPEPTP